tara:strand:+ start:2384 stop:2581 length:198 start_codon:yes stop_codon:yes gene_type:complete
MLDKTTKILFIIASFNIAIIISYIGFGCPTTYIEWGGHAMKTMFITWTLGLTGGVYEVMKDFKIK